MRSLVHLLLFSIVATASVASAQFRRDGARQAPVAENTLGAMTQKSDLLFGFIDPDRFTTQQSYSFSFSSNGQNSLGLGVFTNRFAYTLSDNVRVSADLSAVYSPFSTFGDKFTKSLNGLYLSDARLDWKLGETSMLTVLYSGGPTSYFSPFGLGTSRFEEPRGFGGWKSSSASITTDPR